MTKILKQGLKIFNKISFRQTLEAPYAWPTCAVSVNIHLFMYSLITSPAGVIYVRMSEFVTVSVLYRILLLKAYPFIVVRLKSLSVPNQYCTKNTVVFRFTANRIIPFQVFFKFLRCGSWFSTS